MHKRLFKGDIFYLLYFIGEIVNYNYLKIIAELIFMVYSYIAHMFDMKN